MDSEDFIAMTIIILLMLSPLLVLLSITLITAAVRTRKWQKTKLRRLSPESNPLHPTGSDSEDEEILDSEDEQARTDKLDAKREEEADMLLTTKEKFKKEMWRGWSGGGRKEMERKKRENERSERKKLAKEIVREMRRVERNGGRRRAGKVEGEKA